MSEIQTSPAYDPTVPIKFDFGPFVDPVARAGSEAYRAGRAERSWVDLAGHQRFRWRLVAHLTWEWPDGKLTGQTIRDIYLTLVAARSWSSVSRDDRQRWQAVRDAMVAARDAWRREHAPAPAAKRPTPVTPARLVTSDASVATLTERLRARRRAEAGRC